jgi:hypothetical protein
MVTTPCVTPVPTSFAIPFHKMNPAVPRPHAVLGAMGFLPEHKQVLQQMVEQQKQMLEKLDTMEKRTTITHWS